MNQQPIKTNDLNKTTDWENKLSELAVKDVADSPPNAAHARLTSIDGTGTATLASQLKKGDGNDDTYGGFALILKDDTKFEQFEWLQFVARQLVVGGVQKTGDLVNKVNTTSYQLVDSATEITDYASPNPSPPNWASCWSVDSFTTHKSNPFFRYSYEYAISSAHKLTAIMDAPTILVGKSAPFVPKDDYQDLPGNPVAMRKELGFSEGTSRVYFTDYLMKKKDGRWHIYARFDFSLTWEDAKSKDKNKEKSNFKFRTLSATETTSMLPCHMQALSHTTTPGKKDLTPQQPWLEFRNSIE
ncbi:hypothetical protein F53441_13026 [Fusarium austroafricanum]|uniref:Uncharacterized protein n=1 Tax=Fusarium austroafricanum TaxID=2364996 RepID=A0A8H4NGZ5_9HYPO|nr:hypothetical protein F53441_13026 [Fusarium austroafricanum]